MTLLYILPGVRIMSVYLNLNMLGKRVRAGRLSKDMTQYALAEEVGVSQNFLGDIERGIKAPSITTAIRLANVLNMSLDTMFADSLTIPANEVADVYLTDKQLAVLKKMVKEFRDNFME